MALADNLVAYWKMEEASGDRADSVGSNTLTSNNSVGQNTGKIDNCAQFNAASSRFLSINDNADISMGDVDCTFMCWIYFDNKSASANGQRFFSKDDSGTNREYLIGYETTANKFTIIVWSSSGGGGFKQLYATTLGSPSNTTWYQIFAWNDSTANTLNISVNDGTVDSTAHASGIYAGAANLTIGSGASIQYMDGRLDEMAIWKRVLTAGERTQLYNSGNGLAYPFGDATQVINFRKMRGIGF